MSSAALEYVDANGIRFAFFSEGKGPLVLMLHGFPDTAHTWDHVRPLIAKKGYRVVTPFLRGYAPTGIPETDPDAETLGRDALSLIEALGETSAILVGHDWGAFSAYSAAQLEPARVKKLITLVIPHPATFKPSLGQLWLARHMLLYKLPGSHRRFAADDFAALRAIYARWSPTWEPPDDELASVRECFSNPESLKAAFGYYRALSFVIPAYARRKIDVPSVLFAGLDDPIAKLADYERSRRIFTGECSIEAMPGGHFIHREHPDVFATRLLAHF